MWNWTVTPVASRLWHKLLVSSRLRSLRNRAPLRSHAVSSCTSSSVRADRQWWFWGRVRVSLVFSECMICTIMYGAVRRYMVGLHCNIQLLSACIFSCIHKTARRFRSVDQLCCADCDERNVYVCGYRCGHGNRYGQTGFPNIHKLCVHVTYLNVGHYGRFGQCSYKSPTHKMSRLLFQSKAGGQKLCAQRMRVHNRTAAGSRKCQQTECVGRHKVAVLRHCDRSIGYSYSGGVFVIARYTVHDNPHNLSSQLFNKCYKFDLLVLSTVYTNTSFVYIARYFPQVKILR